MTKANEIANRYTVTSQGYKDNESLENEILEYAKQQAIAFDQWKHDNKWVQHIGFDTPTFNKEKPEVGKQAYFSSEELYNLFLQSNPPHIKQTNQ